MLSIKSCFFVALALAGSHLARATDYTFAPQSGNDGDWGAQANWTPSSGPPGSGDKATIPNGKTCRVENASQVAREIVVDSGGTLAVLSRDLTLGTGSGSAGLTVNGTLYLDKTTATTPRIVLDRNTITISGSGTVTASAASGYGPAIIHPATAGNLLIVNDGVTVKGAIAVNTAIYNYGLMLVDHADDVMDVCPVADVSGVDLQGDGIFRVTAGQMRIGAATQTLDSQAQFDLQGGELNVTQYATNTFMDMVCKVFVSGGVLDVDSHFQTSGAFSFTGGCMEVAPQKVASFLSYPPE